MTYRVEKSSASIYRVMDGDQIVGMAMRCTNKQWVMTDTEGATIGRRRFPSAKAAAEAMEALRLSSKDADTMGGENG